MVCVLIHSVLVSVGPQSYPKCEFRITFELDRFEAQLGFYTSKFIQWLPKPLYSLFKYVKGQFFYPYRGKIIILPFYTKWVITYPM